MVCEQVELRRRRVLSLCGLLGLAAFASAEGGSKPAAITSYPADVRGRNVIRLSTETCDECSVMENFYDGNYYGFLLFMEHSLMGGHKYKEAIIKGVLDVCKDLRWSRIACGMIDMVTDRAYAERYIDPKTAPAHITIKDGQPLISSKELVAPLLAKPGDKETIREHLFAMLKDEGTAGNLTISQEVKDEKAFSKILKEHDLVIASFAHEEQKLAEAFRCGVQTAILQKGMKQHVGELGKEARKGKGSSVRKAQEKLRIAFVAAKGAKLGKAHGQGSIVAFVNGEPAGAVETMDKKAKPGDKAVVEMVKKVTEAAIKVLSHGPAPSNADTPKAAKKEKKEKKGKKAEL